MMQLLVGPPYSMAVSPSCVRERTAGAPAQDMLVSSSLLFGAAGGDPHPQHEPSAYGSDDNSSDSSSSIGDPGDTDGEEEEEEDDVSSSKGEEQRRSFGLDSLEDSLPVKRGLSNHFTGKSKSFGNLLDVSTCSLKDVEKPENPFNKRRRLLMANKWSRKSFYSWQNPKSMPLLPALNEVDDDDHHHHNQEEQEQEGEEEVKTKASTRPKIGFKSQSCFSLADLQEEDDDE